MKLCSQILELLKIEEVRVRINSKLDGANLVWFTKDIGVVKGWLSTVNDYAKSFEKQVNRQIDVINKYLLKDGFNEFIILNDKVRIDFKKEILFLVSDALSEELRRKLKEKQFGF